MYKLHLILKYLRKRRIAWVSLIAVTLCTAMVLVVISVMGGWLRMFLSTSQALDGDIIIRRRSATGFAHYQDILDAVRKMPQVKAATSVITTYGVANFNNIFQDAVSVKAFGDLDQVGKINSFQRGLYRQYIRPLDEAAKAGRTIDPGAKPPTFDKPLDAQAYRDTLPGKNMDTSTLPGIIVGTYFLPRNPDGTFTHGDYIYTDWVKLSVGQIESVETAAPQTSTRTYWIVDDCRTKFYPVDANTVYVPFDKLQQDLGMSETTYKEKIGDQFVDRIEPARVTEIEIALNAGVPLYPARDAVQAVVDKVLAQYEPADPDDPVKAESWDQHQAQYIGAILHEKVLMTVLFGIISVVAVFLVFCIFYMIVVEKTRDIGIIKSVGATNAGVAQIFLGYGLSIGLLGGGLGLLSAYLIVHNINALHAWMGRAMGIVIWDPQTYIFDTIPNTMAPGDVIWIVGIAVMSALAGAMVPAFRAARLTPLDALRWE
jgi:lipoprotein-releasing system permease protein